MAARASKKTFQGNLREHKGRALHDKNPRGIQKVIGTGDEE